MQNNVSNFVVKVNTVQLLIHQDPFEGLDLDLYPVGSLYENKIWFRPVNKRRCFIFSTVESLT